jgi:hypothetical protein
MDSIALRTLFSDQIDFGSTGLVAVDVIAGQEVGRKARELGGICGEVDENVLLRLLQHSPTSVTTQGISANDSESVNSIVDN